MFWEHNLYLPTVFKEVLITARNDVNGAIS